MSFCPGVLPREKVSPRTVIIVVKQQAKQGFIKIGHPIIQYYRTYYFKLYLTTLHKLFYAIFTTTITVRGDLIYDNEPSIFIISGNFLQSKTSRLNILFRHAFWYLRKLRLLKAIWKNLNKKDLWFSFRFFLLENKGECKWLITRSGVVRGVVIVTRRRWNQKSLVVLMHFSSELIGKMGNAWQERRLSYHSSHYRVKTLFAWHGR